MLITIADVIGDMVKPVLPDIWLKSEQTYQKVTTKEFSTFTHSLLVDIVTKFATRQAATPISTLDVTKLLSPCVTVALLLAAIRSSHLGLLSRTGIWTRSR